MSTLALRNRKHVKTAIRCLEWFCALVNRPRIGFKIRGLVLSSLQRLQLTTFLVRGLPCPVWLALPCLAFLLTLVCLYLRVCFVWLGVGGGETNRWASCHWKPHSRRTRATPSATKHAAPVPTARR